MKCKHNVMDEFSQKLSTYDNGGHVFFYYNCNECGQHFQRDTYKLRTSEDISESEFKELA